MMHDDHEWPADMSGHAADVEHEVHDMINDMSGVYHEAHHAVEDEGMSPEDIYDAMHDDMDHFMEEVTEGLAYLKDSWCQIPEEERHHMEEEVHATVGALHDMQWEDDGAFHALMGKADEFDAIVETAC